MFKRIVVGMDGSERADHAFDVAAELARAAGGSITIAHIDEQTIGKGGGTIRVDEPEIVSRLKGKAKRLSEAGIEAHIRAEPLLLGTTGSTIAAIAAECDADLIVVGTRGRSAVKGALLGSAAHRLLSVSHVPVLVVPDADQQPAKLETEDLATTLI